MCKELDPYSRLFLAQSFDPPIVLSVADFEQLLLQGGIEQQDEANRALMDCSVFVSCLRQQVQREWSASLGDLNAILLRAGGMR